MFSTTRGIEEAIYEIAKSNHLDFNGMKIHDCLEECRKVCPELYSDDELKDYATCLVEAIKKNFGFTGLRVYYSVNMKGIFGNEMLAMKYEKLIDEIKNFIKDYQVNHGLESKLDVCLMNMYISDYYRKEYGVLDTDKCMDLFSLVNTVHLMNYDPKLIDSLKDIIEFQLCYNGLSYYLTEPLDVEGIRELCLHIAEELGHPSVYKGHQLFYDYDGYGGVVLDVNGGII